MFGRIFGRGLREFRLSFLSAATKWQTIAQDCAKSEEEKTLDVFDESESVRMTEVGEFFGKRERQKRGCNPSLAEHNKKGLAVSCIVLQT